MKFLVTALGAGFFLLSAVRGQGLLDIGSLSLDPERLPVSLSITSSTGWDSDPRAGASTGGGTGASDGQGSGFWENNFVLHYPLGHGRSRLNVDVDYSNIWNFDPPPGAQEFQNNGGLHADYFRQINQRLSFGDALHFSHQTQPDFSVGDSINRPTSGYYSGSNRLWVDYNWTSRFSTATSHTVNYISYDDEAQQEEDNTRHTFSEELRYSLTQKTRASLNYRFSFSDYPHNPEAESQSHFLLLGVDRPLGRFFSVSVKGGAEFRSYDGPLGDETSPYSEASINYLARKNTTFRCYYRSGLEDTGSAGQEKNFSRRIGLTMSHHFSPRLALNVSLDNVNADYSDSPAGLQDRQEDTFHTSVGLSYFRPLSRRINFNANYSFTMVDSDDPFAEYDRHRVSLGLSANF